MNNCCNMRALQGALISTRKNHVNLDLENKFINDSNIPLYTIWGDSDSAVVL
jgi:hypothetical protein